MHRQSPLRTCIGCRQRAEQNELVRLVLKDEANTRFVAIDRHRRMPGRGAWLHPDRDCLEQAQSKRGFNRAFKASVDFRDAVEKFEAFLGSADDCPVLKGKQ